MENVGGLGKHASALRGGNLFLGFDRSYCGNCHRTYSAAQHNGYTGGKEVHAAPVSPDSDADANGSADSDTDTDSHAATSLGYPCSVSDSDTRRDAASFG